VEGSDRSAHHAPPIQDALEEQKNELESKNQECKEELDKLKRRLQAEQPMVRDITLLELL
jgi:sugar-specific transcriptional regulator TrmB